MKDNLSGVFSRGKLRAARRANVCAAHNCCGTDRLLRRTGTLCHFATTSPGIYHSARLPHLPRKHGRSRVYARSTMTRRPSKNVSVIRSGRSRSFTTGPTRSMALHAITKGQAGLRRSQRLPPSNGGSRSAKKNSTAVAGGVEGDAKWRANFSRALLASKGRKMMIGSVIN